MYSVILLGAPGSGKGTIASKLAPKWGVPHISTGDLFRNAIKNRTELGLKVEEIIQNGQLVPDDLTIELVRERFTKPDVKKGYIVDGLPRTIPQAEALDKLLDALSLSLDKAVLLDVTDELIINRIGGRRVCTKCGHVYHIENLPPKNEGICDICGSNLIKRKDDTEEIIKDRLSVYYKKTEPLVNYYKSKSVLKTVDASQDVDELVSGLEL